MSVRVRFAPSPTGLLHIGGARTALYSYLFAKAQGGSYVLRIEDTDLERSKKEYEEKMLDDLKWLGLSHDEGPDVGGEFGPYRQSERFEIYQKHAWQLVDQGLAYPCFLSANELDELTEKAKEEKIAPHAYHGKYRDLDPSEAKEKIENGTPYVIRFKNPGRKWSFQDIVRGEVTFPADMVGDFVILRASGLPVYNFCCVIDDYLMKISHVIRAEEHLNNTCRQLMLYDALKAPVPQFAHVSLLVGEDRQKLSKRHGATSVDQYREQKYLPNALMNYLCLLGWSHPEEKDIFNLDEIVPLFDLKRFSKSSAFYDIKKLNFFNEQHLRALALNDSQRFLKLLQQVMASNEFFSSQSESWQLAFGQLFVEKVQLLSEFSDKICYITDVEQEQSEQAQEVLSWESTPLIQDYITEQLSSCREDFLSTQLLNDWMDHCKKTLKIKGKPLFMGLRWVLTGKTHGPDLKQLVSLTPREVVTKRLQVVSDLS